MSMLGGGVVTKWERSERKELPCCSMLPAQFTAPKSGSWVQVQSQHDVLERLVSSAAADSLTAAKHALAHHRSEHASFIRGTRLLSRLPQQSHTRPSAAHAGPSCDDMVPYHAA